jgi:hypothetical protein
MGARVSEAVVVVVDTRGRRVVLAQRSGDDMTLPDLAAA